MQSGSLARWQCSIMHVKYAASEQGAAAALMLCPEEEEKNQRGKEGGFSAGATARYCCTR
jgi:hypothetical protein